MLMRWQRRRVRRRRRRRDSVSLSVLKDEGSQDYEGVFLGVCDRCVLQQTIHITLCLTRRMTVSGATGILKYVWTRSIHPLSIPDSPWTGRQRITGTNNHSHSHSHLQSLSTPYPYPNVFGLWEDPRVPFSARVNNIFSQKWLGAESLVQELKPHLVWTVAWEHNVSVVGMCTEQKCRTAAARMEPETLRQQGQTWS